jgi:DivIVA domain-containing protein
MDLTSQVLHEVEFREAKRGGYHTQDVDEFLERLAVSVDRQEAQLREARQRVAAAEGRIAEAERRAEEAERRSGGGSEADETLKGDMVCAKCFLKKPDAKECQDVLLVKNATGEPTEYYVTKNDVSKESGEACTTKIPASQSFTRVWAPSPPAIPTSPSPAIAGPMLTPSSPSTMSAAITRITAAPIRTIR